jgi:hypothetical protein
MVDFKYYKNISTAKSELQLEKMTCFRKIFVGIEVHYDSALMIETWQGVVADASVCMPFSL